jgi:hypothetical protein
VLQADFLSLGGTAFVKRANKASPLLVAVLGSNAQTMSTFVSTQKLLLGLLGEKYTHDKVAQAVVDAAYRTFKAVDASNAATTLVNKTNLVSLYSATYQALTGTPVVAPAAIASNTAAASTGNTAADNTAAATTGIAAADNTAAKSAGNTAAGNTAAATTGNTAADNTAAAANGNAAADNTAANNAGSTGRRLLQSSSLTPEQLQNIFGAVARAVSSTNTQVQQLVESAKVAAADPASTVDTSDLMVSVSKMATVQQQSPASDISTLATNFAANPSTTSITTLQDVSVAELAAPTHSFTIVLHHRLAAPTIASIACNTKCFQHITKCCVCAPLTTPLLSPHLLLQAYTGDALTTRLAAVQIDKAAVESAMESAVPAPTPVPPTPAPKAKSLGWAAAPVVGGCALVALVAAVGFWIAKRRAAQGWDAQYVDFGSVQRTVRVQYAVRCLVRCLYAAVKGTCNVLVKVSLEVTY